MQATPAANTAAVTTDIKPHLPEQQKQNSVHYLLTAAAVSFSFSGQTKKEIHLHHSLYAPAAAQAHSSTALHKFSSKSPACNFLLASIFSIAD